MSWRALLEAIPKDASLRSTLSDVALATTRRTSRRERAARLRESGLRPTDCPHCGGLATVEQCTAARPDGPARIQTILRCQERDCGACLLSERGEGEVMTRYCARRECRREFEPSRDHQRYCSDGCRNHVNNRRRKEKRRPRIEAAPPDAALPKEVPDHPAMPTSGYLLELACRLVELPPDEFDAVVALSVAQRKREQAAPANGRSH